MATRSLARSPARRARRDLFGRLVRRFADARALRRQRTRLVDLEPRMLRDIGVTEDDALREARRTLWDVPEHWRR